MRRWLALPGLLLVLGCGPTLEAPAVASRRQAILGGAADTTTKSVFLLDLRYSSGNASICSAVLVSPRVLLTAGHCADPAIDGSTSMTIKATNKDNDMNLMSSDFIDVTLVGLHPSWNPSNPQSYDVAALLLASVPPGVTPVPLNRTAPTVGTAVRLVGYGRISPSNVASSGTRRSVNSTISAVGARTFDFGVAGVTGTCVGDSGGAAFVGAAGSERLAGTHSFGSGSCGDGADQRMDIFASFVDGFIAANDQPLCTADGRCRAGCTPVDPDCPVGCEANAACVAGCTPVDPDCAGCPANGTCIAGCSTADPDCAGCGSNGACVMACSPIDPDCTAGCAANGTCVTGCASADPDCAECGANGACIPGCLPVDPDCATGCGADGACVTGCSPADPDCADCGANGVCSAVACPVADTDCADCGANLVCSAASCPAPDPDCPFDGDVCTQASECPGSRCELDPRGFNFCTRACAGDAECFREMTCQSGLCRAPPENTDESVVGGCSAAGGPASWSALALLMLGLLLTRRRG